MMQEMTRESFYNFAADEIRNYIPSSFETISIVDMKNSRTEYKGLLAKKKNTAGVVATPVVNLDKFYDLYSSEETSLDELFSRMANIITMTPPAKTENITSYIFDWEKVKDRLFVIVSNEKKINTTVKRSLAGDIAIVPRILIDETITGVSSTVVQDVFTQKWNKTYDEVIDYALNNTKSLFGVHIFDLNEMFSVSGMPSVKVVSNKRGNFGAAALFYPGILKKLANILEGSFYVLPSSVDEFIIVPDTGLDVLQLAEIVKNVNTNVVDEELFLSNIVFYYNHKTEMFEEA